MKLSLILSIALCSTRVVYAAGAEAPRISRNTVKLHSYNESRVCRHDESSNQTVSHAAMFTFNFQDGDGYRVYQVPRCLFNTHAAREVLSSVDMTETLESYRKRFRVYFVVPIYGAYRLVARSPTAKYPGGVLNPPPASSVTMQDLIVDATNIHTVVPDKLCVITDHPVIFSMKVPCNHQVITWTGYTVTVSLAQKFFVLTIKPTRDHTSENTLAMFFGDVREVDLKAPYTVGAFLLRQTPDHDLLVVVKQTAFIQRYMFLTDVVFLQRTLSADYADTSVCLRVLSVLASVVARGKQCGLITRDTVEFFFTYSLCQLMANGTRYQSTAPVSTALWRQSELELFGEFIVHCFKTTTPNPTPAFQTRMQITEKHKPAHSSNAIDVRVLAATYSSGMHAASMADLAFLLRSTRIPPNVNTDALLQKLLFTTDAYYRMSLKIPLSGSMRRILIRVDLTVRTQLNESSVARRHFVLLTSMCSPREQISWGELLMNPQRGAPSEIYSPCVSGGRRDYTGPSVRALMESAHRPERRAEQVMSVTEALRPKRSQMSDEANCVPDSTQGAVITANEKTYLISSDFLVKGLAIPVSNTVVDRNLMITVLDRRSPCVLSRSYRERGSVIVMNNITFTERCEFCASTLVEYDEVDGLTSIMHIPSIEVLKYLTDPENDILVATPRVHYLLLTANGTVFEVTDILVNVRPSMPYSVVVALVIIAILMALGLYRLCRQKR
ncbi:M75 protein [Murid betaherpesvirus 1]|uniref:M75 protein n=1 Tax=Murid herpesvirus 1 TaxID=10366 RepID=H2A382_MUHV1|nr:M75 protein [Murid betaherpesvirus 1]